MYELTPLPFQSWNWKAWLSPLPYVWNLDAGVDIIAPTILKVWILRLHHYQVASYGHAGTLAAGPGPTTATLNAGAFSSGIATGIGTTLNTPLRLFWSQAHTSLTKENEHLVFYNLPTGRQVTSHSTDFYREPWVQMLVRAQNTNIHYGHSRGFVQILGDRGWHHMLYSIQQASPMTCIKAILKNCPWMSTEIRLHSW